MKPKYNRTTIFYFAYTVSLYLKRNARLMTNDTIITISDDKNLNSMDNTRQETNEKLREESSLVLTHS